MKQLTLEQIGTIRTSLFTIKALSEDSARPGASKQHRQRCASVIREHAQTITDILSDLPDCEAKPAPKPRAPRARKTTPAPEPMLALEG